MPGSYFCYYTHVIMFILNDGNFSEKVLYMHYRGYHIKKLPKYQKISSVADINDIEFVDGLAEVEVPVKLLSELPLKNHERSDSPRLISLLKRMRSEGYSSSEPVIVRVGRQGRWVVVDGGHRLTAADRISKEFWTNLIHKKIGPLIFYVYETPMSYSKMKKHPKFRKKKHRIKPRL